MDAYTYRCHEDGCKHQHKFRKLVGAVDHRIQVHSNEVIKIDHLTLDDKTGLLKWRFLIYPSTAVGKKNRSPCRCVKKLGPPVDR